MTIEERLAKDLGYTDIPELAVWMLKNGKLINGSHEGRQRDIDHHEIGEYFKPSKYATPGSSYIYVKKFMNRGNIRMGCSESGYCLEFTKVPTQDEFNQIQRLINRAYDRRIKMVITRHTPRRKHEFIVHETPIQFMEYVRRHTRLQITCLDIGKIEIF